MFTQRQTQLKPITGHMTPAILSCELFAVESNYRWNDSSVMERQM